MSLVLHKKYFGKPHEYLLFIKNRFLRIYPGYWLILLFTVVLSMFRHELSFASDPKSLASTANNLFIITNITYFLPNASYTAHLLNGPSWSLGIEFLFYLIAPFVIKNKKILLGVFVGSLLLNRIFIDTKFFQVFYLFFLGCFSYLLYVHRKQVKLPKFLKKRWGVIILITVTLAFVILLVPFFPTKINLIQKIYYVLLMLIIPFVFSFSAKSRFDKLLGDLSYPMYVSHAFVIQLLLTKPTHSSTQIVLTILSVFILSFLLYRFVDLPIQKYKHAQMKTPAKNRLS